MRFPRLTVFLGSFCLMVIELVAGRMMAPYLGVSLYTWTAIIGVILAGISLGNYLGGHLADRAPQRELLAFAFLAAGFSTWTIPIFASYIGTTLTNGGIPLPVATLVFSAVVFFIPCLLLSFVTPIVIKILLKDLNRTGNVVGQIYAISTLGSILGTFATGYFLIAWVGTRTIVLAVGVVLLAVGVTIGLERLRHGSPLWLLTLGIAMGASLLAKNPCQWESDYYCIRITPHQVDGKPRGVALQLDRLVHGYVDRDNPNDLGYQYEKSFAALAEYVDSTHPEFRTLFLGGGAYVLPRYLERTYPGRGIEVAEIDPKVTAINYSDLWLDPATTITTHNLDARIFFQRISAETRYDLVFGDVFNDLSVPYHLTTREFNELIRRHLTPDGFYAANIIDNFPRGQFLAAFLHTVSQTFPYVYLAPLQAEWTPRDGRFTYVVLAGEQPITPDRWQAAIADLNRRGLLEAGELAQIQTLVDLPTLQKALPAWSAVVLTDDYAPVDNMLAPVFQQLNRD